MRFWVGLGGAVAGVSVALLPTPEGLTVQGQYTAGVAVVMAVWWLGSVLPMAVTAMLPLVAFPLLGIVDVPAAAKPYAHHLNFLMLGGFILGHAMERVGLHQRFTATLLRPAWVRRGPRRVLLALMVAAAILSGMVSNTATMVMMLPIAGSLAVACGLSARATMGFMLALAYACSIGGTSTLIGTPPNAVLAGEAARLGTEVGFASWMTLGVPFVLGALPLAWFVVTRRLVPDTDVPVDAPPTLPWRPGERAVLALVGLAFALWLTRQEVGPFPGWGHLVPEANKDATVAIGVALLLFLVRTDKGPLLTWPRVQAAVPWSVLLLLGGGFSLAGAIKSSGLTAYLAGFIAQLDQLPEVATVLGLCLGVSFLTEMTSNTATTQILAPLLGEGAVQAGIDPLRWMVPATLSASCAFMMPVATVPNAIAIEAGGVSPAEMAKTGVVLNVLCALLAAGVVLLVA